MQCRGEPLKINSESDFFNYHAKSQQFKNTLPSPSSVPAKFHMSAANDLGPDLQRSGRFL
jgi:hypothetical protein